MEFREFVESVWREIERRRNLIGFGMSLEPSAYKIVFSPKEGEPYDVMFVEGYGDSVYVFYYTEGWYLAGEYGLSEEGAKKCAEELLREYFD